MKKCNNCNLFFDDTIKYCRKCGNLLLPYSNDSINELQIIDKSDNKMICNGENNKQEDLLINSESQRDTIDIIDNIIETKGRSEHDQFIENIILESEIKMNNDFKNDDKHINSLPKKNKYLSKSLVMLLSIIFLSCVIILIYLYYNLANNEKYSDSNHKLSSSDSISRIDKSKETKEHKEHKEQKLDDIDKNTLKTLILKDSEIESIIKVIRRDYYRINNLARSIEPIKLNFNNGNVNGYIYNNELIKVDVFLNGGIIERYYYVKNNLIFMFTDGSEVSRFYFNNYIMIRFLDPNKNEINKESNLYNSREQYCLKNSIFYKNMFLK